MSTTTNTSRAKPKTVPKVKQTKNKPYQLDLFTDDVHETEHEYFSQKLKAELQSMFPTSVKYEDN